MPPSPRPLPFTVGERVRVAVSVDDLRTMQEGHGGWNHKMAEVGLKRSGGQRSGGTEVILGIKVFWCKIEMCLSFLWCVVGFLGVYR